VTYVIGSTKKITNTRYFEYWATIFFVQQVIVLIGKTFDLTFRCFSDKEDLFDLP